MQNLKVRQSGQTGVVHNLPYPLWLHAVTSCITPATSRCMWTWTHALINCFEFQENPKCFLCIWDQSRHSNIKHAVSWYSDSVQGFTYIIFLQDLKCLVDIVQGMNSCGSFFFWLKTKWKCVDCPGGEDNLPEMKQFLHFTFQLESFKWSQAVRHSYNEFKCFGLITLVIGAS